MAKRKIWVTDEKFTQMRHQYAGGGKVSSQQNQLMQIIQAYCQATGANPKQVVGALQKMKPEQQQAAVQQMAAQLQGSQQNETEDEMMAGGGIASMFSKFLGGMGGGEEKGAGSMAGGDMSGNILGASLGYMQSSFAGLADAIAGSSPGAGMTRIVPDSRPTSLNSNRVMAGGGIAVGVPVNVEHGEVLDTGTAVTKVQGKTHEKGGENRSVPEGTTVFSERISIDGKTMAQRKVDRERAVKRIAKVFEKNPGDYINQNTLKRTMQVADIQEQQDLQIQEAASAAMMPPQVQPGAQPGGNPQQDAQVAAYGSSGIMKYAGGTGPDGTPVYGFNMDDWMKENEPEKWKELQVIRAGITPTFTPAVTTPFIPAAVTTPATVTTPVSPVSTGGAGALPLTRPVLGTAGSKTYKNTPQSIQELQAFLASKGYKLPKSTKADGSYDGIAGDEVNKAIRDYNNRGASTSANRGKGVLAGQGTMINPNLVPKQPWQSGYYMNVINKGVEKQKDNFSKGLKDDANYYAPGMPTGVTPKEFTEETTIPEGFETTPGDKLGTIGMTMGTAGPSLMTLANRFGDKPNVNAYANYGTEAKKSSKAAMANLGYLKDSAINDITLSENAAFDRNKNTTRSLSTNRALDLTTMMAGNKAKLDAREDYAKQMMAQFGVDAQINSDADKYRMAGADATDQRNRADRDNFFSQFATNLKDAGTTVQNAGKNKNTALENKNFLAMMPDLSKYGLKAEYDALGNYKGLKTTK